MDWFQAITHAGHPFIPDFFSEVKQIVQEKPMSELTKQWMFKNVREFDLPYVKRTYLTNYTTLDKDGWTKWVVNRINNIMANVTNDNLKLSVQIQYLGGENNILPTKTTALCTAGEILL